MSQDDVLYYSQTIMENQAKSESERIKAAREAARKERENEKVEVYKALTTQTGYGLITKEIERQKAIYFDKLIGKEPLEEEKQETLETVRAKVAVLQGLIDWIEGSIKEGEAAAIKQARSGA